MERSFTKCSVCNQLIHQSSFLEHMNQHSSAVSLQSVLSQPYPVYTSRTKSKVATRINNITINKNNSRPITPSRSLYQNIQIPLCNIPSTQPEPVTLKQTPASRPAVTMNAEVADSISTAITKTSAALPQTTIGAPVTIANSVTASTSTQSTVSTAKAPAIMSEVSSKSAGEATQVTTRSSTSDTPKSVIAQAGTSESFVVTSHQVADTPVLSTAAPILAAKSTLTMKSSVTTTQTLTGTPTISTKPAVMVTQVMTSPTLTVGTAKKPPVTVAVATGGHVAATSTQAVKDTATMKPSVTTTQTATLKPALTNTTTGVTPNIVEDAKKPAVPTPPTTSNSVSVPATSPSNSTNKTHLFIMDLLDMVESEEDQFSCGVCIEVSISTTCLSLTEYLDHLSTSQHMQNVFLWLLGADISRAPKYKTLIRKLKEAKKTSGLFCEFCRKASFNTQDLSAFGAHLRGSKHLENVGNIKKKYDIQISSKEQTKPSHQVNNNTMSQVKAVRRSSTPGNTTAVIWPPNCKPSTPSPRVLTALSTKPALKLSKTDQVQSLQSSSGKPTSTQPVQGDNGQPIGKCQDKISDALVITDVSTSHAQISALKNKEASEIATQQTTSQGNKANLQSIESVPQHFVSTIQTNLAKEAKRDSNTATSCSADSEGSTDTVLTNEVAQASGNVIEHVKSNPSKISNNRITSSKVVSKNPNPSKSNSSKASTSSLIPSDSAKTAIVDNTVKDTESKPSTGSKGNVSTSSSSTQSHSNYATAANISSTGSSSQHNAHKDFPEVCPRHNLYSPLLGCHEQQLLSQNRSPSWSPDRAPPSPGIEQAPSSNTEHLAERGEIDKSQVSSRSASIGSSRSPHHSTHSHNSYRDKSPDSHNHSSRSPHHHYTTSYSGSRRLHRHSRTPPGRHKRSHSPSPNRNTKRRHGNRSRSRDVDRSRRKSRRSISRSRRSTSRSRRLSLRARHSRSRSKSPRRRRRSRSRSPYHQGHHVDSPGRAPRSQSPYQRRQRSISPHRDHRHSNRSPHRSSRRYSRSPESLQPSKSHIHVQSRQSSSSDKRVDARVLIAAKKSERQSRSAHMDEYTDSGEKRQKIRPRPLSPWSADSLAFVIEKKWMSYAEKYYSSKGHRDESECMYLQREYLQAYRGFFLDDPRFEMTYQKLMKPEILREKLSKRIDDLSLGDNEVPVAEPDREPGEIPDDDPQTLLARRISAQPSKEKKMSPKPATPRSPKASSSSHKDEVVSFDILKRMIREKLKIPTGEEKKISDIHVPDLVKQALETISGNESKATTSGQTPSVNTLMSKDPFLGFVHSILSGILNITGLQDDVDTGSYEPSKLAELQAEQRRMHENMVTKNGHFLIKISRNCLTRPHLVQAKFPSISPEVIAVLMNLDRDVLQLIADTPLLKS